jgi:hypothetical protein
MLWIIQSFSSFPLMIETIFQLTTIFETTKKKKKKKKSQQQKKQKGTNLDLIFH